MQKKIVRMTGIKGRQGSVLWLDLEEKSLLSEIYFMPVSMPEPYSDTFYIGYYKMKLCLKKSLVNMYITNI